VRLRIPTNSQHRKRLNIFGWVAPVLGRVGLIKSPHGNREGFLDCLRDLYGKLRAYTIWLYVDQARWHLGKEVEIFIKTHKRLHMEYLPRYQPGLNMQERIWRRIRYEATTNGWFEDLDIIWETVQYTAHSWTRAKIKRLCQIT
jgi:hypothetical protein